jgi:adenosylcobinamide-GDP ribazoletransferase
MSNPFLASFLLALQFLTRLPVPSSSQIPDGQLQGRSVLFYPAVGLVIGLLMVLLHLLLVESSSLLQAALLLVLWVGVTGALHLDGLADLADAWVGGQGDRERTLEIMKDSRSGPLAVAAVVLLLLVKFSALAVVVESGFWGGLLLLPLIGRASLIAALLFMPYVREDGLGSTLVANLPREQAKAVLAASGLGCLLFWGWSALGVLAVAVVAFYMLRQALMRRLGGVTGDAAGALCELIEAVSLVALALTL